MPKIRIVCSHCDSADVRRDAFASWDTAKQEWVLAEVYDAGHCVQCGGEARLEEKPLFEVRYLQGDDLWLNAVPGWYWGDVEDDDTLGDTAGPFDTEELARADMNATPEGPTGEKDNGKS